MNEQSSFGWGLWTRRSAAGVLACLSFVLTLRVDAQVFRDKTDLLDFGIRVPVFSGATRDTLPMPSVALSRKGEDGYDFKELWYRSQWMGQWSAAGGARLSVGAPTWMPPPELLGQFIDSSKFNTLRESGVAPKNPEELAAWIGLFAGAPATPAGPTARAYMHVLESVKFNVAPTGSHAVAYAFRFRPNAHGVNPSNWFVGIIESKQADATRLATIAEQEWLAGLAVIGPPRAMGQGDGVQPPQGEGADSGDKSASSREVSLLAAQRSIEGKKGWWSLPSRNFVVVTSVKPTQKRFVEGVLQDLETLRSAWTAMIPPVRPIEAVSVIRMFVDSGEYLDYVGAEHKNSGGLWMPSQRELMVRSMDHLSAVQQREWQTTVLYHEGMHQYLFYAYAGRMIPVWYNEGLATFMEGAECGRSKVSVEEPSRYASVIDEQVRNRKPMGFESLIAMSYDEFYSPQQDRRRWNYASSWALMYYLRKGAEATGSAEDKVIFDRFYRVMGETGDGDAASRAAFEGVDIAALEERFIKFWKSSKSRSAARKADPFAAPPS